MEAVDDGLIARIFAHPEWAVVIVMCLWLTLALVVSPTRWGE